MHRVTAARPLGLVVAALACALGVLAGLAWGLDGSPSAADRRSRRRRSRG